MAAVCEISQRGLKFSTHLHARTVQGHAYLQHSLFRSFHFQPLPNQADEARVHGDIPQGDSLPGDGNAQSGAVEFVFPLSVFLECLNVFGHGSPTSSATVTLPNASTPNPSRLAQQHDTAMKMVYNEDRRLEVMYG